MTAGRGGPETRELNEEDSGFQIARSLRREIIIVQGEEGLPLSRLPLGEALTFGRDPTASPAFRLDDTHVSREHARVQVNNSTGEVWVVDCSSRNGTYVDGNRITRSLLTPGSVIRMGRTLMIYDAVMIRQDDPTASETDILLGPSFAMGRLRGWLKMVAPKPIPVLVLGESGVGKECVARELHRMSGRKGAFVPVNCAAIPNELAESELFGHAAGAFSGARQASEGLLCASDGGTLFLDEIGELPLPLQAKLLRALADGEVRQVGSTDARRVDLRVVAATNRDLIVEVDQERFRHDLYARLEGWTIVVPPLRVRREDILPLARAFLARLDPSIQISLAAAENLLRYGWPYNVRELQQAMASAATRAAGQPLLRVEDLPPDLVEGKVAHEARNESLPALSPARRRTVPDATELRRVLSAYNGNIAQTAEHFGRARQQIYRWAERYGINLSSGDFSEEHTKG